MAASGNKRISVSGTSAIPVGSGGDQIVASIVFEVSSQSSLSMKTQLNVGGSGTTPADCVSYNVLTGAPIAAGTAIAANGVYAVFCPGSQLSLTPSAGTATVDWAVVYGKVG